MRSFKNVYEKVPLSMQSWRSLASQYDRLVIEIGAGAGFHAIQFAKANPKDFLIAIERTQIKSQKMLGRVAHHPALENIFPVCGDAVPWICKNCTDEEVDEYIILYPNPYPKAAQANKRFINMPFMGKLIATLKSNGTILFATNIESHYLEIIEVSQKVWGLSIASYGKLPNDFTPRSHFEKKYLERGDDCYQIILKK